MKKGAPIFSPAMLHRFNLARAKDEFMRAFLKEALEVTSGDVQAAAILCGRNRTDMYRILKQFDVVIVYVPHKNARELLRRHPNKVGIRDRRWAQFAIALARDQVKVA